MAISELWSDFWWRLRHGPPPPRQYGPSYAGSTPEEEYYRSEEHFHEMPYEIGDLLPRTWSMHAASPLHWQEGWPSYDRPIIYRGSNVCPMCAGRGIVLYGRYIALPDNVDRVLDEKQCDFCAHTGYAWAKRLAEARAHGYSTVEEYNEAERAESAQRELEKRRAYREHERQTAAGWAGWRYAEQLFGPVHDYLHDEDKVMDWLYKARALIGAAILVAIGIHYHQPTKDIAGSFAPVLGGVTEALILAVFSVIPATMVVLLFTRPGKRDVAFHQMMRYPAKVMLICLVAYTFVRGLEHLAGTGNALIDIAVLIIGGLIFFRWILFPFRAIYLITVGMCRLGDGHPLLPPIIGTAIVWVVASQSLLSDHIGLGEPAVISRALLLGGPISITALAIVEFEHLRKKYPDDFPFRDGPLPIKLNASRPNAHRESRLWRLVHAAACSPVQVAANCMVVPWPALR